MTSNDFLTYRATLIPRKLSNRCWIRFQLLTGTVTCKAGVSVAGKKGKVMERRLLKDFHIGIVEGLVQEMAQSPTEAKNLFGQIAKVISRRTTNKKKDWNAVVRRNTIPSNPIGSAQEAEQAQIKRQSLRRHILGNLHNTGTLDDQKLIGRYILNIKL